MWFQVFRKIRHHSYSQIKLGKEQSKKSIGGQENVNI
jgi:hypothetical protein